MAKTIRRNGQLYQTVPCTNKACKGYNITICKKVEGDSLQWECPECHAITIHDPVTQSAGLPYWEG